MHLRNIAVFAFATLGSAASAAAFAQTTDMRMPYQSGFWGHAGASLGRSELKLGCPSGTSCDDTDTAFRAFVRSPARSR